MRASDSDGIAEGSLALPTLLAGLVAADPSGARERTRVSLVRVLEGEGGWGKHVLARGCLV